MGMQDMEEYDDYYEDEEDEYEEEEEEVIEEPRKPSAEELEYLELRQQIKEQIRKKMQRQNGSKSISNKKQAADNYGSFFGPSQPVIAQRVIQESKSLLENPHMAVRAVNGQHTAKIANKPSSNQSSRNTGHDKVPRVQKEKVQQIKPDRDYSFLSSEDYQVPAPSKEPKPHSGSAAKYEARPAHVSQRNVQASRVNGKNVHGRQEERKFTSGNSQMHSRPVLSRTASGSKLTSTPLDSRRHLSNNGVKAHGQPATGMKASHSNAYVASGQKKSNAAAAPAPKRSGIPVSSSQKKIVPPIAKNSIPAVNKQPPSRMPSSTANQRLEQRKPVPPNKAKVIPRNPVASSRPQMNNTVRQVSSHGARDDNRPRKKPARQLPDDDDDAKALAEIRKMFNTSRFAGRREDDDDSDMEANYDDILREEARSARIARREDEEEARLIEEEERRERMRKMKKRKLRE